MNLKLQIMFVFRQIDAQCQTYCLCAFAADVFVQFVFITCTVNTY